MSFLGGSSTHSMFAPLSSPENGQEAPMASQPTHTSSFFSVNLDDDDDFGFGDIESEIRGMEHEVRLKQQNDLLQKTNEVMENARSTTKAGFSSLPSQSEDSLAFHSAIMESFGKKFAPKNKGTKAKPKKVDSRTVQKAQDAKDKFEARLGGAVRNKREKKRNTQY